MEQHSTLFVKTAENNVDKKPKHSLFPAADNISHGRSATDSNSEKKDLDWLENKSFTADTAKKFVEFQEEFKLLQGGESQTEKVQDGSSSKITGQKKHDSFSLEVGHEDSYHRDKSSNSDDKESLEAEADKEKNSAREEKKHLARNRKHKSAQKVPDSEDSDYEARKRKKKYDHSSDSDSREKGDKRKKKYKRSSDSESSGYSHHHRKKKKSKHHKKKKSHKKDKGSYEKTADQSRSEMSASKKIFLEEFEDLKPEHAFRLHRSGDPNSWTYGSLYKLHIPNYRCYFHGCLGSRYLSINDWDPKKKNKTLSNRYYGKENRGLVRRMPEVCLVGDNKMRSEQPLELTVELPSYMEVESKESVVNKSGIDIRQQILDKTTSLYIQGKGVGEVEVVEEEKPKDPVLVKVAEYNRKLREFPHDVPLWLEFVKFQDTLIEERDVSSESKTTESDAKLYTRSALEKKISIIDKALESNPGNLELQLAKLGLCRDMWDATKISKELEQLLFVHPANVRLWKHYLMFNQSRMSVFTVSKVTRLYHKCLKTLNSVIEGKLQTHTVPETLAEDITGIFVQYCYFLKQAGHREKCVATLQAMLEYNVFCPPELESATKETKMATFEKFWESSCSKLGTIGAEGWKAWSEGKHKPAETASASSAEDDLEDLEQEIIDKKGEKFEIWLEIESLREGHHWFPWQPDISKGQTEEDCEDVERLVLFDDISPAMFNVPQHLYTDLVMTFVDILGLKDIKSKLKSDLLLENTNEMRDVVVGSSFSKYEWQQSVIDFAVNLLQQVILVSQGSRKLKLTLAMIEIQLQRFYQQKTSLSKSDQKKMRKIVKNVLKDEENRNNLFLWAAYIDLERVVGKAGEAWSVAETALAMYSGMSVQDNSDNVSGLISLCGQYCEILLHMKEKLPNALWDRSGPVSTETKKKVMSVIHCLIEGKKFNVGSLELLKSTDTLKVGSKISKLIDIVFDEMKVSSDIANVEMLRNKLQGLCWCYSLFTYCAKDLTASLGVHEKILSVIHGKTDHDKFTDLGREILAMQLRLILYHMSTSSASLHILRESLDKALSMYPDEEAFISLFIDIERKSRISGRFNRFFDTIGRSPKSPVGVALAVGAQLKYLLELSAHGITDGSSDGASVSSSALVHRTRRWLERCLSQSDLQHCPILWRLYLQLEREVGNITRLKGIFYRAIQQCPWVKSLYTEGISSLGCDKLQELVDLMVEKELRVQIPVEELDILLSP